MIAPFPDFVMRIKSEGIEPSGFVVIDDFEFVIKFGFNSNA